MAKKSTKTSKTQRKRAAKRNKLIRQFAIYGVIIAICIICLVMIPIMNRPVDRQTVWTPAVGAAALDAAPVASATPTPGPTPEPTGIPDVAMKKADALASDAYTNEPEGDEYYDDFEAGEDIDTEEAFDLPGFEEPADDTLLAEEMAAGPVTITLTAAGDCTLGGCLKHDTYKVFKKYVDDYGYNYFLQNVRSLFQSDDLTIVNLEGPLTDVGTMTTKSGICFRGDPEWTAILTGSGVELCNYANNHNMDMGEEGFNRTLQSLEDAGLGYCVYDKVYHATIKGVRITALGFDKWANKQEEVVAAIQRERPDCDLLIVNCHWGREMHYEPMSDQKAMAHAIVDAGADLVIGTHPHVYGGVELYKGKYIAYSLGNFCFGGNTKPSDQRAMIFQQQFIIQNGQVTDGGINIIPCLVSGDPKKNDFQPYILAAKEGTALLKKIAHYSINLGGGVNWMPGSYPEQIGLVTPRTVSGPTAVPLVENVATPVPTVQPADQVFTAEDGFDTETDPQPSPTPTVEPLTGLGSRTLSAEEAAAMQEQIYYDQMGSVG